MDKSPDEPEVITVWITKYALTRGVYEIEAQLCAGANTSMIKQYLNGRSHTYYHKGDWFLTETAAQADAQVRRDRKIASLEKQILKLKKLTF